MYDSNAKLLKQSCTIVLFRILQIYVLPSYPLNLVSVFILVELHFILVVIEKESIEERNGGAGSGKACYEGVSIDVPILYTGTCHWITSTCNVWSTKVEFQFHSLSPIAPPLRIHDSIHIFIHMIIVGIKFCNSGVHLLLFPTWEDQVCQWRIVYISW